jgi:hypothetical protein
MFTRLFCTVVVVLICSSNAHAFVFTDLVAKVQRIVMIGHATKHLEEFQKYQGEFDYYKKEFDKYFVNFKRVYRRLSPSDWKDFTPANWGHLYDHVIGIWKTFDPVAYDTQVAALKLSPLYTWSAEYKDYVDRLVTLSDQQVDHLKKEEAHLMMLQAQDAAHHDALERFKSRNAGLVMGEDSPGNEVALTQQVALLNAILIEIASIQAETKVVQQRLLTQQQEARNLIMRMKQLEIESQKGDSKNLEQLLQLTRNQ